jgi:putative spermidine/putrescine transport system ATP-binding protein
MGGDPHVILSRVSKHYDNAAALTDVNLAIGRGEFVSLLGPSGSGKTTALMIVAGFEKADTGTVRVAGVEVTDVPAHRRDQGIVFQHYALFPHLSVRRNLEFPLQMRGVDRREITRRVAEMIELIGLTGLDARRPRQLSGGQQQRVALARAIIAAPPIVLMDEPLGALDRNLRDRMRLEIKRLQRELRLTVLYVTHDQDEALTMSDRVAIMRAGRIEQIDTPERVYHEPRNAFVANFLGHTNVIDSALTGLRDGVHTERSSLRPERILIARTPPAGDARIWLPAIIEDSTFLGGELQYRVRTSKQTLLARELCAGDRSWQPGEQVFIGWRPADATPLSSEGE